MSLKTTKRLAADILGVGVSRIRVKVGEEERASSAMTRADVRDLIKEKVVYALPKTGRRKKEKRKRKGPGKRKGKKYSRKKRKELWMEKIRAQRKYLADLVKHGILNKEYKREIYMKIKAGSFRGKKALFHYLQDNEYIPKSAKYEDTIIKDTEKKDDKKDKKPKKNKKLEG